MALSIRHLIRYSRHNSNIIVEPFQDLDLESNSYSYEAIFVLTAIAKPTQDLILGFSFTHQNTQLSLGDSAFRDLARGSDADGRTIISALRLVQEYSDRSQNHIFSARSQFAIGLDAFGSTINHNELPDSKFLIGRGQLQYLKAISPQNRILFFRFRSHLELR